MTERTTFDCDGDNGKCKEPVVLSRFYIWTGMSADLAGGPSTRDFKIVDLCDAHLRNVMTTLVEKDSGNGKIGYELIRMHNLKRR